MAFSQYFCQMDKDLILIKATLEGNKASFATLVEDYQDFVFTIAFKILRKREEAEEAAQDTFLKAYKSLGSFEGKSKFATWLYQIAWRTAIDKNRGKTLKKVSLDDSNVFTEISDNGISASESLHTQTQRQVIQQALEKLKPEDAALINLYYLNEQSVKEICEITGQTESNIKVRLFRLRDTLKNQLTSILKNEVNQII
jgi:RNA polymerase sigma-70 factor (ECF subfamily)